MKCAVCNEKMKKKNKQLELSIHGKLYILEKVPYEECEKCGEKVVNSIVSKWIFAQIRNKHFFKKCIELPVIPSYHHTVSSL